MIPPDACLPILAICAARVARRGGGAAPSSIDLMLLWVRSCNLLKKKCRLQQPQRISIINGNQLNSTFD